MLPQLENEPEIIRRCQSGDLSAFRPIYDTFSQTFLRVALRLLGNQADAEDAVQGSFLKLYRGIHTFRREAAFGTFFMRILLRACFDLMHQRRRFQTETLTENPGLQVIYPDSDLKLDLQRALTRLPKRMRVCFVLFAVEGLKQEEIAAILKISVGGVKSNIFHAKSNLRRWLAEKEVQ